MKAPVTGPVGAPAGQLCGFCPHEPERPGGPITAPRCALRRFRNGATVAPVGATTRQVGFVVEGVLRLVRNLPDGHQQIVGLLMPGDHFGELFVEMAPFVVECASDVLLCSRDRLEFEAMLARHPDKEHALLASSVSELCAARQWMSVLGLPTIRERVAAFLLILIMRERGGIPDDVEPPIRVCVPVSRRDMANFIGTRPETVSRVLHRLARDGLLVIESVQKFIILDHAALLAAGGGEVLTGDHSSQAGPTGQIKLTLTGATIRLPK